MEKWKLSIEDYHRRKKKLTNALELKVPAYAPRTRDRHLKQYIRRSIIPQRRNSEPVKSFLIKNFKKLSHFQKQNPAFEEPSMPISFPSSSDILAKSRDSVKNALLTSGRINSESLKRNFVSYGGKLVPLPFKRPRWSIESMDETESSATRNLKSITDCNQSTFSKIGETDKAATLGNKVKLNNQHCDEFVCSNPAKNVVGDSTKKGAFSTSATDQRSPTSKISTGSICSQLNKVKHSFSEQTSFTDSETGVFKSTSSNVSNTVTVSPYRKDTITTGAKLVIEYESSSPKVKDTHMSKTGFSNALLMSDRMNSETLKRNFVSYGGKLVPLPFKRPRWSIESMDDTESLSTRNLKSITDCNQSTFPKIGNTDKAVTLGNKVKLNNQHRDEFVCSNPAKDGIGDSTKKGAFSTSATDQRRPTSKISTGSICSQLNKVKHSFSEQPTSTDSENGVFKSTSSNVSNGVTVSPNRKNTITTDAKLVIEHERSSPKIKDTHMSKTGFFKRSQFGCSSPKRIAFPLSYTKLIKKRKIEYRSKLFQKSTNFKPTKSNVTKDKELCFKSIEKTDEGTSEKIKYVKSSYESTQRTNNLTNCAAIVSPKSKDIYPNKSPIKNQKAECSSKHVRNLFNQKSIDSKPNEVKDSESYAKPMKKIEDSQVVNEKTSDKKQTDKSRHVSPLVGNYLLLSNAWSQKRNNSTASNSSLNKNKKFECNSEPLSKSKDPKNSKSKSNVVENSSRTSNDSLNKQRESVQLQKSIDQKNSESKAKYVVENDELSSQSDQKSYNLATIQGKNAEDKSVKSSSDSSPLANYVAIRKAWLQKEKSSRTSNAGLIKKKPSEGKSKPSDEPFQKPVDKKASEFKSKDMINKELCSKPAQKTEVATINKQNIEESKSKKSSTDSSWIANYLELQNARSLKKKSSVASNNTNSSRREKTESNFMLLQKSIRQKNSESKLEKSTTIGEQNIKEKSKSSTDSSLKANYLALQEARSQKKKSSVASNTSSSKKGKSEPNSMLLQKSIGQKNSESKLTDVVEKRKLSVQLKQKDDDITNTKERNAEKRTKSSSKSSQRTNKKESESCFKSIKTVINERTTEKRNSVKSSSVSPPKTNDLANCTWTSEMKPDKTRKRSASPLVMLNSPVKKNCGQVKLLPCEKSPQKGDTKCFARSENYCIKDSQLNSLEDSTKENRKSISRKFEKLAKKMWKLKKKRNPDLFSSKGNSELPRKISRFRRISKIGSTKKLKMGSKCKRNMVKKKHSKYSLNTVHILDIGITKFRRWSTDSVISEDSNDVQPSQFCHNALEGVVITDIRHFPETNFELLSDCEGSANIHEEESNLALSEDSTVMITNVRHVSESDFHLMPDCEDSVNQKQEEKNNSSEFNTPLCPDLQDNQSSVLCYKERKNIAKGKNFVLSYKKYKNGKVLILMFDFENQTCKRIPLKYFFATKTVLSAGLPLEVVKKSLYAPSILHTLSIECCIGFILSEVFLYKAVVKDKCSNIIKHCLFFSILRHLKIHSQCEVNNLFFKGFKGHNEEVKLKASWINLQKLTKIISKGILKSGHWEIPKKSKSEPYSVRCSNVSFIDKFFYSFNCILYADTFRQTFLSSKRLFCYACLLNYEEFSREYLTGVFSDGILENRSVGSCHNPCICVEHLSNLRNIHKDSFCVSLKKKGISFNVLKDRESFIDLGETCFLKTNCVSNSVPFSFICEEQKNAFYFIFTKASLDFKHSTKKEHTDLIADASNNCFEQYPLAINSLKQASLDLYTNVYESVFKLIPSQKSNLSLFPSDSNRLDPPMEVSSPHIEDFFHANCVPEPSHAFNTPETAEEVKEQVPQNFVVDTLNSIDSFKSPCIGNLFFFDKKNIALHCTKDYDDMFSSFDLFKEGSTMRRYYDHLRKTGCHELGFRLVSLNGMSEENMASYSYLMDKLDFHKAVLLGMMHEASKPRKETSDYEIQRILEQLEIVAGYEFACKALLV